VRGRDLYANAGLSFWDDGEGESNNVDSALEEFVGHGGGESSVAEHDGNNGMIALWNVESCIRHFLSEIDVVAGKRVAEFGGGFE